MIDGVLWLKVAVAAFYLFVMLLDAALEFFGWHEMSGQEYVRLPYLGHSRVMNTIALAMLNALLAYILVYGVWIGEVGVGLVMAIGIAGAGKRIHKTLASRVGQRRGR